MRSVTYEYDTSEEMCFESIESYLFLQQLEVARCDLIFIYDLLFARKYLIRVSWCVEDESLK